MNVGANGQVCSRCVMDESEPYIEFDSSGVCSHCRYFDEVVRPQWFPDDRGGVLLERWLGRVAADRSPSGFDCILGLSGGVDSSYLALKAKEFSLNPLVVHVDAGWNSEIAVSNIEKVVDYCGFELFTKVLDWDQVRDLQLALLRSNVANQDVVQDHAFFAALYGFAASEGIRHVLNGGNFASEAIFPKSWHHAAMDSISIRAIHERFGTLPLDGFPMLSFFDYYIKIPYVHRIDVVRPLNWMHYDKASALKELQSTVDYKDYGRKHGESLFTRFFQNYFLPTKFGYDKRRPHLSSLILSGSIARESAIESLLSPLYEPLELSRDLEFVSKKLGISVDELEAFAHAPGVSYLTYPNWDRRYRLLKGAQVAVGRLTGRRTARYS